MWEKRGRQLNVCEKERETTEGVRRKEGTECCEKKVEATEDV